MAVVCGIGGLLISAFSFRHISAITRVTRTASRTRHLHHVAPIMIRQFEEVGY